tara:strand:- start:63 stop:1475 length:1413 start_codon:yes stop_codon:yes gene_type:complete
MFGIDANRDSGAGQVYAGANDGPEGVNAPLHVGGLVNTRISIDGSTSSGLYMTDSGGEACNIINAGGSLQFFGVAAHEFVFNDTALDVDFRVESDTSTHALFVQGSDGNVGIGTSSPSYLTELSGNGGDDTVTLALTNVGSHPVRLRLNSGHGNWSVGNSVTVADALEFRDESADATRMMILPTGNVTLGTTTYGQPNANAVSLGSTEGVIRLHHINGTSDGTSFAIFTYNGSGIGSITQASGSSVAFNTSSDYRLKENVVYDWDATARLKQLKPARFNFIGDADKTVDGFLAHEAQAIVPEAITGTKDAMMDEEYEVTPATGDVFTAGINEVTTESQVMETVETGSYVNLAGETIVETKQQGVTSDLIETVVKRQDVDGVSTEVEIEVVTQVPTMETLITTEAVAEVIHSADVEKPDTLEDGQQWRETTSAVMGTRSVPDHQGIDQSKLVPLLVKVIQELEARITVLEG